jgi:RND family efflux transporter MFP subunit
METAIKSRATGYLTQAVVNIGDRVRAGQTLAVIANPEIDSQLQVARATLLQSRANLAKDQASETYALSMRDRVRRLTGNNAAPQEEYEGRDAAARMATATVRAAESTIKVNEATVQRLEAMQSFQKIVAPFAGTITARDVDPGALILADRAEGHELFHLAQVDPLRVLVHVPQDSAPWVDLGKAAVITAREFPARKFSGQVVGTTGVLGQRTQALLAGLQVPNQDHALLPGMSLEVRLVLKAPRSWVLIPAAALVGDEGNRRVAVIDPDGSLHYRNVAVAPQHGAEVKILSGLAGDETLAVNPDPALPDGVAVRANVSQ